MTTPEEARDTFTAFMSEERKQCRIVELREDDEDYFAQLEYEGEMPVGEAFLFVTKATGKLWEGSPGEVLDKIDEMVKLA